MPSRLQRASSTLGLCARLGLCAAIVLASQTKPAREGILAAAAEEIIAAAHRGVAASIAEM